MPTFFSKILNLGKDKDKKGDSGTKDPQSPTSPKHSKRHSIHSLLEGKFEAVSPTVSEQGELAAKEQQEAKGTAESDSDKEKEKDKLVTLLSRPKARTKSPTRRSDDFPRLTLNLTLPSASDGEKKGGTRDLRTVLEGTVDGAPLLDDATLGKTRLSPPEALKLMKACAGVINERGLDTLGVMHPHWHSASPQLQRRLISLFMASIGQSASPKAQSTFEDGMEFTRSPHDIASVFRWALRHLQLEGHSFASAKDVEASTTGPLSWYGSLVDDERTGGYPPTAFSTILLPRVKAPHVDLLRLTADLMSVLAAHSEANGVSGSKLSMILGQYLLIGSQESGELSWKDFYERWENSGRALEHIFLCYLRDETSKGNIPKRVQELTAGYPYAKYAIEGDSRFPRPARFATRSFDALHVLITCEVPQQSKFREENSYPLPLSVIENALRSGVSGDAKELEQAWKQIQTLANTAGGEEEILEEGKAYDRRNLLSRILSDESIRLLSLRSEDGERVNKNTPTITMFSHVPGEARVYSKSHSSTNGAAVSNGKGKESANGISRNASETTATSTTVGGPTPISPIASDWTAFSSSGFGEDVLGSSFASTLLDSDVEKTQPVALESRRSLKKSGSKGHKGERAKSRERVGRRTNVTPLAASEVSKRESAPPVPTWKTASVSIVKLDEAFVDFWADALLDPIARPWPTFVVCQLKSNVNAEVSEGQTINWLVVEQAFVEPPPPPTPPVEEESLAQRASSPKPSIASETKRPGPIGRVSSTFKRFALFGSGTSYPEETDGGKRSSKGARVNEMGMVIPEEAVSPPMSPVPTASKEEKRESTVKDGPSDKEVTAAAAVAVGGVAVASTLNQVTEALKPDSEPKAEDSAPVTEEVKAGQPPGPPVEPESTKAADVHVVAPSTEDTISQPAVEPEAKAESEIAQGKQIQS
ncbi:hypothetical protein SCHPADRAFT_208777 [Schizopora paradoxa]|uniref:Meiotically up-regulated protein Msb1/Mug8 domain-containing protein n=1 Tax=Schizopora paradoxa TaxID=27342 RepID=A0A0H2RWT0_9AGAM|nr:hypothetical protein SCHPADRAFT_208777 [Schizopora paradoxa]